MGSMEVEAALQEVLAEVEALLVDTEEQLRRLEEEVASLQAERYGLQLALARRRSGAAPGMPVGGAGGAADEAGGPAWEPVPWPQLSRAEAVYQVLLEESGPLGRGAITDRLVEVGRVGDDPDSVSAALAYLRRTGRARRAGLGQWVVAGVPPG
jgi:hypothetical protein